MSNVYRFVGIVNVFEVYPDFALPVFEKDENLYVQEGARGVGTGMLALDEELESRVLFIDLEKEGEALKPAGIRDIIEGELFAPIFCFQEKANKLVIGGARTLIHFFDDYQSPSKRVSEEILAFRMDNPRITRSRIKKDRKKKPIINKKTTGISVIAAPMGSSKIEIDEKWRYRPVALHRPDGNSILATAGVHVSVETIEGSVPVLRKRRTRVANKAAKVLPKKRRNSSGGTAK